MKLFLILLGLGERNKWLHYGIDPDHIMGYPPPPKKKKNEILNIFRK